MKGGGGQAHHLPRLWLQIFLPKRFGTLSNNVVGTRRRTEHHYHHDRHWTQKIANTIKNNRKDDSDDDTKEGNETVLRTSILFLFIFVMKTPFLAV